MKVLVACEYSGRVREAFRALGHEAYSCDLLDSDDLSPHHIKGDCIPVIKQGWDIIIMHPPCTALCVSGNGTYGVGKEKNYLREEAKQWTIELFELAKKHSPRVAMENPVGVLPLKATQYIQPWQHGHGETKKTGLWLFGLPALKDSIVVEGRDDRIHKMPPGPDRWKRRSETYQGIANAMAEQWGKNE